MFPGKIKKPVVINNIIKNDLYKQNYLKIILFKKNNWEFYKN